MSEEEGGWGNSLAVSLSLFLQPFFIVLRASFSPPRIQKSHAPGQRETSSYRLSCKKQAKKHEGEENAQVKIERASRQGERPATLENGVASTRNVRLFLVLFRPLIQSALRTGDDDLGSSLRREGKRERRSSERVRWSEGGCQLSRKEGRRRRVVRPRRLLIITSSSSFRPPLPPQLLLHKKNTHETNQVAPARWVWNKKYPVSVSPA